MLQMSARLVSLLLRDVHSSSTRFRGFAVSASVQSYDMRRVEITPLEQRKLTFDTHRLVRDLEAHGFAKEQAETVVSALMSLSAVSLDTVYKDMVTQAQQEITLQQIMFHLDSIRKDMVILEKSEFANLRAENEKMKIELDQVKQQLMNETNQIRAENKLDINLERSRVTDMFTDQERKLMEASTEFHKKLLFSLALPLLWDFIDFGNKKPTNGMKKKRMEQKHALLDTSNISEIISLG
uniref:Coiled-coil domain containing 90B n=1 Tax=Naja naja TaxID=35670 RepID=A0A8C6X877_NAJNA